jgi:hypothetical protein
MAQLLIIFSKLFFDTVVLLPASNGSKKHQKTPFWGISPVSSVTILIKKKLVPPHVIANLAKIGQAQWSNGRKQPKMGTR